MVNCEDIKWLVSLGFMHCFLVLERNQKHSGKNHRMGNFIAVTNGQILEFRLLFLIIGPFRRLSPRHLRPRNTAALVPLSSSGYPSLLRFCPPQ